MKNIIIIGGGISGMALLHYLKKKYASRPDVEIKLLEKESRLGGTVFSERHSGFLFEHGPNGFLDSQPTTLEFVKEVGLESQLIRANPQAKKRFLLIDGQLVELPHGLASFLKFPALSLKDKFRIPLELFVPKGINADETLYEFGSRRFGENFTRLFLDPLVTGIYGGDIRAINVRLAFPKVYSAEQNYGSLIEGLFCIKKKKKNTSQASETVSGAGTLTSFQNGMSELGDEIYKHYRPSILLNEEVKSLKRMEKGFLVNSSSMEVKADELFLCLPAKAAAKILNDVNAALSDQLRQIPYAPMAVVGLLYPRRAFSKIPEGFGYLISSFANKEILGVLFDSNIFPSRSNSENFFIRVMLGGTRHPEILQKSREDLIRIAQDEILTRFGAEDNPTKALAVLWPAAIPQYDNGYAKIHRRLIPELAKENNLWLVANYLNGVSFNDCISNAKEKAGESRL